MAAMSERRRYGQYCGLAKALDIVGERWTLLVVRELLAGPRRFTELLEWLPGLSRTLLGQRLREMQDNGLVRRRFLPPPAASWVYELTERGRGLHEAVEALARWGVETLGPPGSERHSPPLWVLMSVAVLARGSTAGSDAAGAHDVVVDGERHHLAFERGRPFARQGPHPAAESVITASGDTLYDLAAGRLDLPHALDSDAFRIEGDEEAAVRALDALCPRWNTTLTGTYAPVSRRETAHDAG